MPIHEFKCEACGDISESYFKLEEGELVLSGELTLTCKKCGSITKHIMSVSNYKMNGYNERNGYS